MNSSQFNNNTDNDEVTQILAEHTFESFKYNFFKELSFKISKPSCQSTLDMYVPRNSFVLRYNMKYCQLLKDMLELDLKANGWSVHVKECEDRNDPSCHFHLRRKTAFNDFLFKLHDTFAKYEVK